MLAESGMGEVNSRRRHHREGSLFASIVPRPTQGFPVSINASRSGPVLWGHEEASSLERSLSAHGSYPGVDWERI